MRKFGLLSLLTLASILGTISFGCGEDPVEPVIEHAKAIFVHTAPAGPAVDLLLGESEFVRNRIYKDVSTYITLDAGTVDAKLVPTGTTTPLATKSLTFEKDKNYTIFAAPGADGAANDLVLFNDDMEAPEAGKIHIRIANLLQDGPAAIKVGIQQKGPVSGMTNIAFKANSESFTDIDPGAVTFNVQDNAVGGSGGGSTTPIVSKGFSLEAGKIYTLVLYGKMADSTIDLKLVTHN